jgi:hypothetical protein
MDGAGGESEARLVPRVMLEANAYAADDLGCLLEGLRLLVEKHPHLLLV